MSGLPDPTSTAAACPVCPKPVDDHTVRELREHLSTVYDHHLPYEEHPLRNETFTPESFAGSVAIKAAAIATATGTYPVLVFDFGGNDNRSFPPIPLVLDDNAMRNLRRLVGDAIDAARKAARRNR